MKNYRSYERDKKAIKILENYVDKCYSRDCTFWACDGTPENNRIVNMKTCSRCQVIIETSREIKKLKNIKK